MTGPSENEPRIVRSEDIPEEEPARRIAESIARLDAMSDDDIDLSDIPEITDWSNAVRGWFSDSPQVEIRLQIDRDVLRWILREHREFQAAINDALREHVDRERAVKAGE